jgi:hypothetical protein
MEKNKSTNYLDGRYLQPINKNLSTDGDTHQQTLPKHIMY